MPVPSVVREAKEKREKSIMAARNPGSSPGFRAAILSSRFIYGHVRRTKRIKEDITRSLA